LSTRWSNPIYKHALLYLFLRMTAALNCAYRQLRRTASQLLCNDTERKEAALTGGFSSRKFDQEEGYGQVLKPSAPRSMRANGLLAVGLPA